MMWRNFFLGGLRKDKPQNSPHLVLTRVESSSVPASEILSPSDMSTDNLNFGNLSLPKYSSYYLKGGGKEKVSVALKPNPPELKESRQADQDVKWLKIYSDATDTYQADLTFHKVHKTIGKKQGYVQQAILSIINVNNTKEGEEKECEFQVYVHSERLSPDTDRSDQVFGVPQSAR